MNQRLLLLMLGLIVLSRVSHSEYSEPIPDHKNEICRTASGEEAEDACYLYKACHPLFQMFSTPEGDCACSGVKDDYSCRMDSVMNE